MRVKFYFSFLVLISLVVGFSLLWEYPELFETPGASKEVVKVRIGNRETIAPPGARVESSLASIASSPVVSKPQDPAISALEAANQYVQDHRREWNVQEYHDLRPTGYESPIGTKVSYQVYDGAFPILGMRVVLEVDKTNSVSVVENRYEPLSKSTIEAPSLAPNELDSAIATYGYARNPAYQAEQSLVLLNVSGSDSPELAFAMTVNSTRGGQPLPIRILVRAHDGQLLRRSIPRAQ